jgi:hypothetical protein
MHETLCWYSTSVLLEVSVVNGEIEMDDLITSFIFVSTVQSCV